MPRYQVALIVLAFVGVAAVILATGLIARQTLAERRTWPLSTGTVTEIRTVMLARGHGTDVIGQHTVAGVAHRFEFLWGRDRIDSNVFGFDARFVPPADVPSIGAAIPIRYNPSDPRQVVPLKATENPAPIFTGTTLFVMISSLILAILCGVLLPRGR
jgi:uncharacterized protein DUF3592